MADRRVVVTGLGALTPIGNNVEEYWSSLQEGKSGAAPITHFDPKDHKTKFACEVKGFDPKDHFHPREARRMERFIQMGIVTAREAIKDSGLDISQEDANRCGVIFGSGIGGLQMIESQVKLLHDSGPGRVSPFLIPSMICNMAAGYISIELGLKGPSNSPVTACATGTHAIGDAATLIKMGKMDIAFAGGSEAAVTALGVAGFENMKALSGRNDDPKTASRPFDAERDGFVIGEGSGIIVLEEYEHAKARGAKIYCEMAGYGLTSDSSHITAPAPEGEGAQRAMKMAVEEAGIALTDVNHINAHGTSTPLNDKNESAAINAVFGEHAKSIAVCSTKSMTGHLLGGAGGIEAVALALSIKNGVVPPTINYKNPDPECDLDYTPNKKRELQINAALSNTFGFGGHNATILLKRLDT